MIRLERLAKTVELAECLTQVKVALPRERINLHNTGEGFHGLAPLGASAGEDPLLEEHERKLREILAAKAAPCSATLERVTNVAPTDFDPRVIDLVRAKANALSLSNMDMPSGAGHDAMHIAKLCPAGMIFVPCERGISHNEIENATPSDLAAGTRVLVEVLEALANR